MADERLLSFCNTDRQREIIAAVEKATGNQAQAARDLGCARGSVTATMDIVRRRAAKSGYSPDHDMTHTVPEGYQVKGVSTLYDSDGNVAAQWVKSTADQQRQQAAFEEAIRALTDEIPRAKATAGPKHVSDSLMACYPVGDHHLGMLSWGEETGADYDLTIAEQLLVRAFEHLIQSVPACEQCLLPFLGDFLHYDSFESVTPTNKNLLDSDTRFPKMVRAAIRVIRCAVKMALARHASVRIVIEPGNHDPASSVFLREAFAALYEKEPRVTVDTSPRNFHYLRFGKCLVGITHGHGPKPEKLPLIMATDRPEDWGATEYRYWWTGHIHHDRERDFEGCRWESFRILAPADAWAANKGFRSARNMKAIVLHKEFGEVVRHIVNPSMLESAA